MYNIIRTVDGAEIGSTENVRYIRKSASGCYIQTDEKNAEGIVHCGIAYNLEGREGLGAEGTVMLIAYDAGQSAYEAAKKIAQHSAILDSLVASTLEEGE